MSALNTTAIDATVAGDQIVVALADGRRIAVPLAWSPRLADATSEQRKNWRLIRRGEGIHWPDVDEDISGRVTGGTMPDTSKKNRRHSAAEDR